jgi:S-adenosylmethionine synthetase
VLLKKLLDEKTIIYHINPTGRSVTGGPMGDTGLTGRKIIVDTYGGGKPRRRLLLGQGPDEGRPFGILHGPLRCQEHRGSRALQRGRGAAGYAIGVPEPVSIHGTISAPARSTMTSSSRSSENFDMTPKGIVKTLNLRRPIYKKTAAYGHFGRTEPEFTWEKRTKPRSSKRTRE